MASKYLKLFVDSLEKYQKLNDAEFGRLIRAALTYKTTGEEVELKGREELLWDGMKLEIDRDNEAYKKVSDARSDVGKKGAYIRWNDGNCHNAIANDSKKWQLLQDKDKEEDKDKDKRENKKERSTTRFSPPSLEDVKAYCDERKNGIDPQGFIDYYSARDWMSGKTEIKDWKACVRTWERRENKTETENKGSFNTDDYFSDALLRTYGDMKGE